MKQSISGTPGCARRPPDPLLAVRLRWNSVDLGRMDPVHRQLTEPITRFRSHLLVAWRMWHFMDSKVR
jgi:hypothetical protein